MITNNDDIANHKPNLGVKKRKYSDIASPMANLGVQKNLVPVNGPKKRVKRKCWTRLKSGLFGWKTMTEDNTQKSDVEKPNKIHTQSEHSCPPNNLKPQHCPNKSVKNLTFSKWLLTANQNEGGGKNRDNWVHASEKSFLENDSSIETTELLAGKIQPSKSVKGHRPADREKEGKKRNPGGL